MNLTYSRALSPPLDKQDHVQGLPSAAITLVEYCDYHSAQCAEAHQIIKQLQCQLGEQLCFVLRHFPSPYCPQAFRAAEAAEAASAQGKFWQMHNMLLLAHQQALEDADLVEYAVVLDLSIPEFLRKLSTRVYAARVQADIASGRSNQVEKTPTFFISVRHTNFVNVRHVGTQNLDSLLMTLFTLSTRL